MSEPDEQIDHADDACLGEDRADPDSPDDHDIAEAWEDAPVIEPAEDA